MKKRTLISIVSVFVLSAYCTCAHAASLPDIKYDYSNNRLEINGDSSDSRVILQILKYGKSISDITDDTADINTILYAKEYTCDENGKYSFAVRYADLDETTFTSGEHNAYLKLNNEIIDFKVDLFSNKDYETVVPLLNSYADSSDAANFKSTLEANQKLLGINEDVYAKLTASDALIPCIKYVRTNHLNVSNSVANAQLLNRFLVMQLLKEKSAADAAVDFGDCFEGNSALYSDYKEYVKTDEAKSYFISRMKTSLPETYVYEDFENSFKKALMLTTVMYASGYKDVKYILTSYGTLIGITGTANDSVYRNIIGEYSNCTELADKYKKLLNPTPTPGGNGVGTGSGGGSSTIPATPAKTPNTIEKVSVKFDDIDGVEWASEAILALADKGIINGRSETSFKPNDYITREEFAKILVCAMGYDTLSYSKNNFTDVDDNAWFVRFVNIAYENKILNGIGDGKFGTGEMISREDISVMVCNAMKAKGKTLQTAELAFEDRDNIAGYAIDSVFALYKMGVINGISDTQFDPKGKATRAQAAKIVYGVLDSIK